MLPTDQPPRPAADRPRVLIIDDEARYCEELAAYLDLYGCVVSTITDASGVEEAILKLSPDLIILDQWLGPTTGTQILRRLRHWTSVPCIVVTGVPNSTDRVLNLEVGADDEVDKSIPPRELLARIRAILRRDQRTDPSPAGGDIAQRNDRGWSFFEELRELRRPDGSLCHLTSAEFETLRILIHAAGELVQRSQICERVFGRPFRPGDRSVDTIVGKLRRKLNPDGGGKGQNIKSVRGVGYVFTGFQCTTG